MGDRPVVTLLQDTDKAKADASAALGAVKDDAGRVIVVKDLLASVGDLETVFGDTDAAAAARDAAQAARDQSQTARDAAQAASTTAGDFAGQAETSKNLSQTAQSAAADAKTAAEAAKAAAAKSVTDASGFASTASGKADIATQKASDAGSSASNASGSAATANTKAGEASASATQALTSKTDAAGSATSASQSATLSASSSDASGKALALQFPRVADNRAFMVNPAANALNDNTFLPATVMSGGRVMMDTVSAPAYPYGLWMRGIIPYEIGKTYEVRARAEWVSGYPDQPAISAYFNIYDAAGNLLGETTFGVPLVLAANVQTDFAARIQLGVNGGAKFIRFGLLTNRQPGNLGQLTVGRTDVSSLYPVDVTDSVASKTSADASSASASAANVSAGLAGTRATAADTSRQQAVTSAGEALAYRNTAATSASTATDAATSATQSSGVSARAALDGSANSANDNRSPGAAMSLWSYNEYNSFAPASRLINDPASFTAVAGQLRVASVVAHVHPVSSIRVQASKRYRVFARYRVTQEGPQGGGHYLYLACFDANGQILTGNVIQVTGSAAPITVADGFVDMARDVSTDGSGGTYGLPAGTVSIRPMYRTSGTPEEIALLYVEDVEGQLAAAASASASSGFASAALASQNAAGQSASAADGYRNLAQTAYGNADASRAAAAVSENNALGSKNSAANSADLSATAKAASQAASKATLPDNFLDPANWVPWDGWAGSVLFDGGIAKTFNGGSLYSRFNIPITPGQTYRITARHRTVNQGGGTTYIGVISDPGSSTQWALGGKASAPVGVWETTTSLITGDAIISQNPSATSARVGLLLGYQNMSDAEVSQLRIENVTSEIASNGFANASNSSAQTAAASADLSGQRASAADTSRIAAETARGGAEVARDSAVTSRNDAQGSANSAATSAALSAVVGSSVGLTPNGKFTGGAGGWMISGVTYGEWYVGKGFRAGPGSRGTITQADLIPVNTTHTYRLTSRIVAHGSEGRLTYAGITCYDVNKAFLGNVYIPALTNPLPGGGVYNTSGEFTGVSGVAPSFGYGETFVTGTVYAQPITFLNYGYENVNSDVAALYLEDITSEKNSRSSASASNLSAGSASASKDAAGSSAAAANQSRIEAQAANGAAQGAASAASGSSVTANGFKSEAQQAANLSAQYRDIAAARAADAGNLAADALRYAGTSQTASAQATSAASQAQSSAVLSASVSGGSMNLNGIFADYPAGLSLPTAWNSWNGSGYRTYGNGDASTPGTPVEGSPWGYSQVVNTPSQEGGIYQDTPGAWGYYVVRGSVQIREGVGFSGAGVLIYGLNSAGAAVDSAVINFAVDPDTSGQIWGRGAGSGTRTFKWVKLIRLTSGDVSSIRLYAMTNWSGFDGQGSPKRLSWLRCSITPASQGEINGDKALTNATANSARIEAVNTVLANDIGSLGIRTNSVEARAGSLESRTGVTETAVTNLKTGQAAARIELQAVTRVAAPQW